MKITPFRWGIDLEIGGWRTVAINCHITKWWFGYSSDWYDGPHKSFGLGPVNLYWNW